MEISIGFKNLVKLALRLISFRLEQFRLSTQEYEVIRTNSGQVRGVKRINACLRDSHYYAFEGIPYAKPPLGELRFRAPQPIEPWQEVLDCTWLRSKPMQVHWITNLREGSEDCLYINIYTRELKVKGPPLPVMVWINGGGYQIGEASQDFYGPDYFMMKDVILVTFNYRVGVFGFLCFDDPKVNIPGNAGIKDQVAALRWIKENIHHFNGDPNNVTVFGESTGASSVHLLMLTPQAEGLFHKAIVQSGSALCTWAATEKHDWGFKLACHLGYSGEQNDLEIYQYLVQQSSRRLATNAVCLLSHHDLVESNMLASFLIVVEPYATESCIADKPYQDLLAKAWGNNIPLIIGGNSAEGLFHYYFTKKYRTLIEDNNELHLDYLLPNELKQNQTPDKLKQMVDILKLEYFQGRNPTFNHDIVDYLDLMGHRNFWHPVYRTIEARMAYASNVATYCYYFDCPSPNFHNFAKFLSGDLEANGVGHGYDLCYFFHNLISKNITPSCEEFQCTKWLIGMWHNFALGSNPNCEEISPIIWDKVESLEFEDSPKCLVIGKELQFTALPIHKKLKWFAYTTKCAVIIKSQSYQFKHLAQYIIAMETAIGLRQIFKLALRFISYKWNQSRLTTREYEIVNTNCGEVRGVKRLNICPKDMAYYAFEGIPYGKPPTGNLRFRAPQPIEPWQEVLDCTQAKAKPMQVNMLTSMREGSEDCLYLNVYARKLKGCGAPLPVMVWIYGGGFQVGEATRDFYGPDYFMMQDVIVVTINYRVGVFGFLCLDDPNLNIPGNAGLKDQVLALKWVKENIHHFNGDANNITVFGESAGATSTHILMLTPQTQGLFHKAIVQSGSALCPWAVTEKHDWGFKLACYLGYEGDNKDQEIYEYLMQQDGRKLATNSVCLLSHQDMVDNNRFCAFLPVVEPYATAECITDKPFEDLLSNAWSNKIPLIIGGTSAEGLFHYSFVAKHRHTLETAQGLRLDHLLPDEVKHNQSQENFNQMIQSFRKEYFNEQAPTFKDHLNKYLELMGHRTFWHPMYRIIEARLSYAPNVATYCYYFDCLSPYFRAYSNLLCGDHEVFGVCHGEDILYLFHNILSVNEVNSGPEYKYIERMIGMWYNFALSSNPNCKEISPITWEKVETLDFGMPLECLVIGEELQYATIPINKKLKCWSDLYKQKSHK
uniref:carboxylesterase n=1 Tax=Stomoxys calcitrans TaxID=35570 RepID=A0A1I8NQM1_STOCA|nr:unnamed protein product [Stomoxys calcitrans]